MHDLLAEMYESFRGLPRPNFVESAAEKARPALELSLFWQNFFSHSPGVKHAPHVWRLETSP